MKVSDKIELLGFAKFIRAKLEKAFSPETAIKGSSRSTASAGQCAAASIVVNKLVGGQFVSALPDGTSHWFNRVAVGNEYFDVDLTGDQFGREPIQIGPTEKLYDGTKIRIYDEVNEETLIRAKLLASNAGFEAVADQILIDLKKKRCKNNLLCEHTS